MSEEGHRVTSGLTEVIVESHLSSRRDTPSDNNERVYGHE